jgi:hypothetical protein
VIKEGYPGGNIGFAGAIEVEAELDLGLSGIA